MASDAQAYAALVRGASDSGANTFEQQESHGQNGKQPKASTGLNNWSGFASVSWPCTQNRGKRTLHRHDMAAIQDREPSPAYFLDVKHHSLVFCAAQTRKPYTITKQRERWSEEEHLRQVLSACQLGVLAASLLVRKLIWFCALLQVCRGSQTAWARLAEDRRCEHAALSDQQLSTRSAFSPYCVPLCRTHWHQDSSADPQPCTEVLYQAGEEEGGWGGA